MQNGVQASHLWDVRQRRGQQRMDKTMTRRERYEAAEVDVWSDTMNPLNEQQAYTQAPKKIPKKRVKWYGHVTRRDEHALRRLLCAEIPGSVYI